MTKKQSIQVFSVLGLIVLSSIGAYGFYIYTQGNGPIEDNYKDNLTFEEVEQKIIGYQTRGYKALREALEENIEQISDIYHLSGNMKFDGKIESPFLGSMNFNVSADDYSMQVIDNTFDFQIGNLFMKYILSPLELTGEESIDIQIDGESIHVLLSEDGLFAGSKDLKLDIPFLEKSYSEAIEYFLGEGKYLGFDITTGDIAESNELSEITDIITQIDEIFLESLGVFLENESLFEVVSQEETKYYLRPSLAACSFAVGTVANMEIYQANMFAEFFGEEKQEYINIYGSDGFHNDVEQCSQEEYKEIVDGVEYFFDGEAKMFIEIANFRTHIGLEIEEENMLSMKAGSVVGVSGIQESYLNIDFKSEEILGDGINLIYTQENGLLGSVDMRDTEDMMSIFMEIKQNEEENIHDMKLQLEAKEDFTQLFVLIDLDGKIQEDKFELDGDINIGMMGFEIENTMSMFNETRNHASEFVLDIDTLLQLEPNSPEVEATTEIRIQNNKEGDTENTISHIKVRAPNMFHLEFNMEDNYNLSNEIIREAITPDKTFTIEELEHRVRINSMKNRARGVDEVEVDLGVIIPALGEYRQEDPISNNQDIIHDRQANLKVVSDLISIADKIDSSVMGGQDLNDMITDQIRLRNDGQVLYRVGYINYLALGLNKANFEQDGEQAYKLGIYITEKDGRTYELFQVKGVAIENGEETAVIRGTYFQLDETFPEGLFNPEGLFRHPRTGAFLQNGDTLDQ